METLDKQEIATKLTHLLHYYTSHAAHSRELMQSAATTQELLEHAHSVERLEMKRDAILHVAKELNVTLEPAPVAGQQQQ